eukprot:CCRYP_002821-RD/>CCRYP_002821-RD protein AED:0.06 eAED:0.06 QI:49/1/1/1/1/1/7/146/1058
MKVCISCMDDDEEVVFRCKGDGGICSYQLCARCIRLAFCDSSGANSSFCALCKTPSAIDMIAAVCGKGAVMAVEQKLRGKVEFKLKEENLKKEASRTTANDLNETARKLFNDLAEEINLKCPRCRGAFHDYEGCNALTCGMPSCKAAFCAICLQDCGHDAHQHVRKTHGDLFDKNAFERSKIQRAKTHIELLMKKLSSEPFELKQLVLNHIEKAKLVESSSSVTDESTKMSSFIEMTKASLFLATRNDRLALLSSPEKYNGLKHIVRDDISPRCAIPNSYELSLRQTGTNNVYQIRLRHNISGDGKNWVTISNIEDHFKEHPKIESLLNVTAAMRCAVVALEGRPQLFQTFQDRDMPKGTQLGKDQVCIVLRSINRDGEVLYDEDMPYNLIVLGLNQNKRMMLLEEHVKRTPVAQLMFEPLCHMIGVGQSSSVVTALEMEVPKGLVELNEQQQQVAHPLRLKTAIEVAGPPGTGKTKTIVELVRALLQCTSFDILLLSERNGAINAVAEKFKDACISMRGKNGQVSDFDVWTSIMTYGSGESMGESTRLFTLDEKLRFHPELADLEEKRDLLNEATASLSKALRAVLAEIVKDFGNHFDESYAVSRSIEITKNKEELVSPLHIIGKLKEVTRDIQDLLNKTNEIGSRYLEEASTTDIIVRHSALLGRLIPIRTDKEREANDKHHWDRKDATRRMNYILHHFLDALKLDMFSSENASSLHHEKTKADEECRALHARLKQELPDLARLHMCTIGSSHMLTQCKNNPQDDLIEVFGEITLNDFKHEGETNTAKETIVIFDEAGCIPAYELLGLTRLGRTIKALVMVGDKHQLPPYDPSAGRRFDRKNSFGADRRRPSRPEPMRSLLDWSVLDADTGKILLTKQYRVPKDIAEMLNQRVYRGRYKTCPTANVPMSGLRMINTPWSECPKRKYVNPNEVEKGLDLLNRLSLDYKISSVLIITPYKNQQREFEYQISRRKKHEEFIEAAVLTIDQCQGQEADAVILSLVRRPTRFLTINRLNVALSRVRKILYVLTDFGDLKEACRDKDWECADLAGDLFMGSL